MDTTVKLQIKISGSDSFKEVEVSADELAKAIGQVKEKADDLNAKLLNANQMAQVFEQVSSSVQALQSAMHSLTEAYSVQSAAEARLEQVMRNTMDATDAEIRSVKELAAAQQKLGVIGDELQLTAAQELATYLGKKESLEKLLPVMNDMIAQQYGYNASAESAASIATMMGKVMDGQVKALSRYGYSFTEAQEEILKFGTEEERAATLAEVVEQSVGGMNAALAATPYGRIVQARNALGDMKETIGGIVAPAMNVVDKVASISIALAGLGKGISTVKGLSAAFQKMRANAVKATVAQKGLNAAMKANVIIAVVSAVAALVAVIVKLARANNEASQETKELTDAEQAFIQASGDAKAAIITEADELMMLIATNNDTTEAVAKLNKKYGEAFGYYSTAAEWYDILKNKSETYCRQLGYEAKAKQLSAEIGTKITVRDNKQEELEKLKSQLPDYYQIQTEVAQKAEPIVIDGVDVPARVFVSVELTPEQQAIAQKARELTSEITSIETEINGKMNELRNSQGKALQAAEDLKTATADGTKAVSWQKMSYEDLGKAIQEQAKKVKESIAANNGLAEAEAATLNAMQQRYDAIGKQFDKLTGKVKNLNTEIHGTAELLPSLAPIGATASMDAPEPTYANPKPLKVLFDFQNIGEFEQRLTELENIRKQVSQDQLPIIDAQIALVRQLKDEFEGVNQTVASSPLETFSKGWGGIKGIGNSIRDIKSALTETDNAWDALTQTVDGFISLFQSLQQVVQVIDAVKAATQSMQAVRDAAAQRELGNATKEVAANTAKAGSGAASSVASIPYVGPVLAIAAMASVIAALASLPKFANGGLVYGPTLGLMGEYGGASSNPEVIAPLSRLRSLLGEGGGTGRSEVKFRIEGRELVGIMNKQNNIYRRSN